MDRILKLKTEDLSTAETVIIVPCYNEQDRLPVMAFKKFASEHASLRFLFVNDGSSDQTATLLQELENQVPEKFEFLDLAQNGGKAEAIRQGVLHAIQNTDTKLIGFWDADLSTPLEEIPRFFQTLNNREELAMVIGTRLSLLGRHVHRKPIRKVLGRLFATVASTALGVRIQDTQCGAKLFRVTPEFVSAFSAPFISKWIFDVEVIARYRQLRRDDSSANNSEFIYEQPLEAWEEVGSSRLKSGDFLTAILDLARIYWKNIRPGSEPLHAPAAASIPIPTDSINSSDNQSTRRKAA